MTQVIIDDIIPRTQLVAAAGQTVFNTNWTVNATTDVVVYARADGVEADDETQVVSTSDYIVTLIGGSQTVRVTFLIGRTLDDVITIVRNTPAERLNLYINTNFVPSMLNNDFGILTLVDQQSQMYDTVINPRYNVSATIEPDSMLGGGDIVLPILPPGFGWRKSFDGTHIEAISIPDGGFAPAVATYLIQVANAGLPNAQVMASLASGFVVNTTSTGVQLSRVFQGTADQIDIADADGIGGNPVWSIADNVILGGTSGMGLIRGTTAERPLTPGANTFFRFNTTDEYLEYWDGANWIQIVEDAGVLIIHGTANQIDVDSTDPEEPILSLSATLDAPGTFTIQGSTAVDEIINDDTLATATATNLATALSIKTYIDNKDIGVETITGTTNEIDVDSTDPNNPVLSLSATLDAPGTFTIQASTAVDEIINDDTLATATATNLATALSIKNYVDGLDAGSVKSVTGTANEIDVDNADPQNPVLALSATLDAPGTFTIQASTAVDEIINDDTMATATATNLATALSIKNYVDGLIGTAVLSVTGTANQIDVDNTDPQNPILSLSSTLVAPGTVRVGNILLDTNTISSVDTNGDLILTPDGTGNLVLDGLNWPQADGTAGYVLATDGLGQLSWVVQSSGNPGGLDTQIQYNNAGAFAGDTGFTTDGAGNLIITGSLNIDNIEIDGNTISSTDTNGNLNLTPNGTGDLVLDGLNWPQADGTAGYFLQTDGAGQLSWQPVSSGSGTVTAASINEIAFYPANGDTVDGIPTANSAMFRTDASGVPGWSASMTDGQLLIGDTSGTPVAANLTAGPGISIANGPGTIQISGTGSGIGWTEVTGTSQAMVADNGYVSNNAGLVTLTLPTTAAFGTAISIIGKGAGGWAIAQNSGQNVQVGSVSSTVGAGGSVASTNRFDSIDLLCTTANTTWTVQGGPQTTGFTIV